MPTTATITTYYVFTPLTTIESAKVNFNMALWRGHHIAIDGSLTAAAVTRSYDLGSSEYRWRNVYGNVAPDIVSTTGSIAITAAHDVVLMDTTAQTNTADLPTAVGFSGTLLIKNIGTAGNTAFIDGSAAQTIDGTITVNLVDLEAIRLVSDQSNWWSI